MNDPYQKHMKITAEVKRSIEPMKVVFPVDYGRIYCRIAEEYGIELDPSELLTEEMLDRKIVRYIISLTRCTDEAIAAIEKEDKEALVRILAEMKKLRAEMRGLEKIIYEDNLTKSFNRKWFDDNIMNIDSLSVRGSGTIVMIDLDNFKAINDTHGHIVGDKVLIHVAKKLKESGGRVVRYGGDEFLLIFDVHIPPEEIREQMQAILDYYKHIRFERATKAFKVDFSYGMATFTDTSNLESVIENADREMYRHKNGKSRHNNGRSGA
jgi:diguanylate cyclase (GGDEF)-like protein